MKGEGMGEMREGGIRGPLLLEGETMITNVTRPGGETKIVIVTEIVTRGAEGTTTEILEEVIHEGRKRITVDKGTPEEEVMEDGGAHSRI